MNSMSGKITPGLIREHGAQLRRTTIDEKRAAEIAEEVARLNGAVIDAAGKLDFNDDPGRFAALLAAAGEPPHASSRRKPGSRNKNPAKSRR
jgi:hypothetical protein